ncbi:MAG: YcnI family protein, partial [Actinomycetota bacterium]|nr:YcnI family protein [Actinomycetota bacterium]
MSKRWILSAGAAGALTLALAAPAAAHVTVQPDEAEQGGYSAFAFRVPNERDDAGTVALSVTLPAEHPIRSVRTKPMPGWTAAMTKDGETVRTITWTADPGVRIGPGEYQEFAVSAGPLPEDADVLVLPAVQTYDNGEVVAWNAPPAAGEEPEHPAPVLELVPGDEAAAVAPAASASSADETARWLGGAG